MARVKHLNPGGLAELQALRRCGRRGEPFGRPAWVAQMAAALGLTSLLRPRGRPRKTVEVQRW
jgi:putative transposase